MNAFDVLVVGGGPAGSAAAAFCAQRGLTVGLIEHHRFPRHKVCGDVLNPGCWPVLDRLGVAAAAAKLPSHRANGAVFAPARGAPLCVDAALTCIQRSLFDDCLLQHAAACGVTIFQQQTAHELLPDGIVKTADSTYRGRYLIGADGRHSIIARQAGLMPRRAAHRGRGCPVVAFQAHYAVPGAIESRVYMHLFPGGYSGAVQVGEGKLNLCIVTQRQRHRPGDDVGELFRETVWQNGNFVRLGIAPEPLDALQAVHPLQRGANRATGGNVMLVGDALRVLEPFTGQGIYFALRSAELAAAAIHQATIAEYPRQIVQLYRSHGRTNEWLRRLMYHHRAAAVAVRLLRHWPAGLNWLASSVLQGYNESYSMNETKPIILSRRGEGPRNQSLPRT